MLLGELIHHWATWLEETPLAVSIATSSYLFPIVETIHVIGVGLVVGTMGIVDLRLLGFASTKRTVRDVASHMLPIAWSGFGIAAISGTLMFISSATHYAENISFQLKLLVLVLAGINMLVFHLLTWRSIALWDDAHKPPTSARFAGAVSLSCWIVIVFLGRWIGFVE
jgi:hypothetical protein